MTRNITNATDDPDYIGHAEIESVLEDGRVMLISVPVFSKKEKNVAKEKALKSIEGNNYKEKLISKQRMLELAAEVPEKIKGK